MNPHDAWFGEKLEKARDEGNLETRVRLANKAGRTTAIVMILNEVRSAIEKPRLNGLSRIRSKLK